jgi:hypothetical protein
MANPEESPYISLRYLGMAYYGRNTSACAFACFLWNVYDKYEDSGFRSIRYNGADNDDVGETSLIWDKFANLDTSTYYTATGTFRDLLKSSVDTSEAVSIEKIYDYLYGDTTPMRPAQVKNLEGDFNGWEENEGTFFIDFFSANLSWDLQDYYSSFYQNLADSIRVYCDGILIHTLPPTATTDLIVRSCMGCGWDPNTFTVTAFNSSGESYDAPTIISPAFKAADGHPVEPSLMTIHPNPAMNLARICVPDLAAGTAVKMIVVNATGEIVSTLYDATPDAELGLCCTLDCSKLPDGIYFARLWNDVLGQSVKLVIQH